MTIKVKLPMLERANKRKMADSNPNKLKNVQIFPMKILR